MLCEKIDVVEYIVDSIENHWDIVYFLD
jgi:hypothetical protein